MRLTLPWILSIPMALAACGSTNGVMIPPIDSSPLVIVDREGHEHDVEALTTSGKPVVLIFWQTWCHSCIEEAPALAVSTREWGDRIQFLGIIPGPDDTVDEAALDLAVETYQLPYPQVRDRDLSLTRRYAIEGTPTILVIGEGQELLFRDHQAPEDWGQFVHPPLD